MAPPGPRRVGWSRRAQYSLFAGYVIAVSGALLGLLLVVTARLDPAGNNAIRAALTDLASPVSSTLAWLTRTVGGAWSGAAAYIDAGNKNAALLRERDGNRRRLIAARALERENARLKQLLGLTETEQAVATGRLVSASSSSTRRFAILSRGSASGVRLGQPVRAPDGLVGRVVEVGLATARVQLIVDTGIVVPVMRVPDGLAALVTGGDRGALDIRPLAPGVNPLRPGDLFITSGAGGVYPPRIPVAVVTRVAGDRAAARPIADPATLDYAVALPIAQPLAAAPPPPRTDAP